MAGDMNAKYHVWNSAYSHPSGEKLLSLFDVNDLDILTPHSPTRYSSAGRGDIFDISHPYKCISVSNYLDSYTYKFLSIHCSTLEQIIRILLIFRYWKRLESLAFGLLPPGTKINLGKEADKAARNFRASIASSYIFLTTGKHTPSDITNNLLGLDFQLKNKQDLRNLWHEIPDLVYRKVVNWVFKTIRQVTRRRALEL